MVTNRVLQSHNISTFTFVPVMHLLALFDIMGPMARGLNLAKLSLLCIYCFFKNYVWFGHDGLFHVAYMFGLAMTDFVRDLNVWFGHD